MRTKPRVVHKRVSLSCVPGEYPSLFVVMIPFVQSSTKGACRFRLLGHRPRRVESELYGPFSTLGRIRLNRKDPPPGL